MARARDTRNTRDTRDTLIVALDEFSLDPSLKLGAGLATLEVFARAMKWKRQAISVVSPDQVKWPSDFDGSWADEFEALGSAALDSFMKTQKIRYELKSEVVLQPTHSVKASAKSLAVFAKKRGAAAIALLTHVHQGGALSLPGAFATSVIGAARAPVLAVNAKAPAVKKLDTILIASDFSRAGSKAFAESLELFRRSGAKLILFHALSTPVRPEIFSGAALAGGYANIEHYFDAEKASRKRIGEKWLKKAWAAGIDAELVVHSSSSPPARAIIDAAKSKNADAIVMTERTGPIGAFLLGSVTRDVLAQSTLPVFVMKAT